MVWDENEMEFEPTKLPEVIRRGFHILQLNYKCQPFTSSVDEGIVEQALRHNGTINCPRHWGKECTHKEKRDLRKGLAFIYASKKYENVSKKLLEKIRAHGLRQPQGEELPQEEEFCRCHCAICQAEIVLINYCLGDLDSAFLLGLAAGCKSYAIQLYNESEQTDCKQQNTGLAMWGSKVTIPWSPETLSTDIDKLNQHLARIGK